MAMADAMIGMATTVLPALVLDRGENPNVTFTDSTVPVRDVGLALAIHSAGRNEQLGSIRQ